MKTKCFTLLSGNYWSVIARIRENGIFRSKGIIQIKNREKHLETSKKYRQTEEGKESHRKESKKYSQTEKGKQVHRKSSKKNTAKRRQLRFIPLNKIFKDSNAHHIDREFVIHIPEEMHESVQHNQYTGQGMEEINELAFDYLAEHEEDLRWSI